MLFNSIVLCNLCKLFVGVLPLHPSSLRPTPSTPSTLNLDPQLKMLKQVFEADHNDCGIQSRLRIKDHIQAMGRCGGGKIPYWVETTTHWHFVELWQQYNARNIIYMQISRSLRFPAVAAPMRAESAPGSSKKPWTLNIESSSRSR